MTDEQFPIDQYKQAWDTLNQEGTRYWARFNISLVINAGLTVAFSVMLGQLDKSPLIGLGTLALSVLGIFFSIIWLKITDIAIEWNGHYASVVKNIESKLDEKLRIIPKEGTIKKSITKTSRWYPKSFIIFWGIITTIFLVYQISNMNIGS